MSLPWLGRLRSMSAWWRCSHHTASERDRHRANGMNDARWSRSEQPDVTGLFDGGAAGRDVELAVDRYRVRLHGVVGEIEPRPDLLEREVRHEQWEHVKLCRCQRRRSWRLAGSGAHSGLYLRRLRGQASQAGAAA